MNPFEDIVKVDKDNNLKDSKLITVDSSVGGGKTVAIHTMILNYIKSGINVILFSETQGRSTRVLFAHFKLNFNKETMGKLITFPLFFEDTIQLFNRTVEHHLEFLAGNTVIVIDGPMFENQQSFSYKKFKNENTRFVLIEKYNKRTQLDILKREEENPFMKKKVIAESLRSLAINFNTHIILSAQFNRMTSISDKLLMYASDIYITTQRSENKENTFVIRRVKDRMGNIGVIECGIDNNNLTFATIK